MFICVFGYERGGCLRKESTALTGNCGEISETDAPKRTLAGGVGVSGVLTESRASLKEEAQPESIIVSNVSGGYAVTVTAHNGSARLQK